MSKVAIFWTSAGLTCVMWDREWKTDFKTDYFLTKFMKSKYNAKEVTTKAFMNRRDLVLSHIKSETFMETA